jgi:formylglycine-generating enzyme required for sulfatase activity
MKASFCLVTVLGLAVLAGCAKQSTPDPLDARLQEAVTLIAEGKREQSVRLLDALAVLHPDDPRIARLRAQASGEAGRGVPSAPSGPVGTPAAGSGVPALPPTVDAGLAEVGRLVQADQLSQALTEVRKLAAAYPQDGRVAALVKQVVAAQPPERPAVLTPEDLAGLERVKYSAGEQLLREAQAAGTERPQVRAEKMKLFLAQTAELATARPGLLKLHLQRATAALEVQDREAGVQAVAALLPLGVMETKDTPQLALLGKLELAGWLAEGWALGEAGPALAELKRLVEAKDYGAFTTNSADFYTKWKGTPAILARAVPLVAAVETATGSDFGGWGIDTNAKKRAAEEAKAAAERREQDNLAAIRRGSGDFYIPELGLQMVQLRPGSFAMGSGSGDSDERPVTTVKISQSYWLGKYEVTQAEWAAVMKSAPSAFKGERRPVENVSWEDAVQFCRVLTERERQAGRLPAGYAYQLPTEAEWEYACRAGTAGDYAGTGVLGDMGWYDANSGSTTHPVGEKRANAWGLHDMHGNVWEWCADWYGSYPGGSVSDPRGADSGSNRVSRGGGWNSQRLPLPFGPPPQQLAGQPLRLPRLSPRPQFSPMNQPETRASGADGGRGVVSGANPARSASPAQSRRSERGGAGVEPSREARGFQVNSTSDYAGGTF